LPSRPFFCSDGQAVEEVEDTGVGIALERIEATCDRFRQVGDTLTATLEGAGLGWGCPSAARSPSTNGGTLIVRSEIGRGRCFRLVLPLAA
jgi:signal transduction histidine kinase